MDIQLIAFDLDGTMLDDRKNIPEQNKTALTKCVEKGIYVVPATGRTAEGIPEQVFSVPGIRYAITVNGAKIEDLWEKKVIGEALLKKELALQVLEIAREYPVMYDVYIDGRGKSEERFLNNLDKYAVKPEIQVLIRKTRDCIPDIYAYIRDCKEYIDKINIFFADMQMREEVRAKLAHIPGIITTSSMGNNLEINAIEATKGNALLKLADYLGIHREQIMAFGDGENDVSMIRDAGLGVAMENAQDSLKQTADYVTSSNNDGGIAAAVQKFVLADTSIV